MNELTKFGILKKSRLDDLNGYIQDLEGSAIANILRNAAGQTVISYITANDRRNSIRLAKNLHIR